ncbi:MULTISPECIES: LacI family DNA-binding transcriptional regulator [Vibrionaceae]|uniref:LacI family DNA-binding transcriptional regulator n=1 Tax=Vibrionaceae TaxID=641 RepID=UPI000809338C|nr:MULTISPECIES: LacI family DNA-binding transcriptional regulator [Vibrionaceae]ANS87798.1 Sucrose operon repressor [Vibrio scophthalmi]AWK84556.1 transcriptional regulator [Photobacterium damselae]MBE8127827.1 LacI family DNA-binding transcriptional regulator [Photobacterium damselae subsp. piscicida]TLS88836.1 LacI family transcriptional regulator [Photobacterium damselae subsp. damselae]
MASLHDVARLAGVSKSTVSRVINDEYGVKDATKVKVRKAVEECGYLPNQVAKDLKSRKTNLVGVIVPRVSSHATSQGVDGLTAVLDQANKHVLLASTHQEHHKEIEYIQIFNQKRVEGIILYATHLDEQLVKAIQSSAVPVVLVGQDGSMFNIPSIVHDDVRVGFEAGNRLTLKGCKNMGFIGVQGDDISVDKMRSVGFTQSLQSKGLTLRFHARGNFTIDSGYKLTKQYLNEYSNLDGLFCATDRIAIGAIKAIQEAGLIPGKDILVLGVGDDELASVCTPTLSTFNYAFDKAGENGARLLLERIEKKGFEMSKMVLTFTTIERETC